MLFCLALGCGDDAATRDNAGSGAGRGGAGGAGAGGSGNGGNAGTSGFDNSNPDAAFETPEDAGPPPVCADLETTPERLPPTVTFLIDGSGSMSCRYPEDPSCDCMGQQTNTCTAPGTGERWTALGDALFDSVSAGGQDGPVASLQGLIRFGMTIYNNGVAADNSSCPNLPVSVAAALDNHPALASAFPVDPPGFNTPTAPALAGLVASLPDAATRRTQGLGPDAIVLATDGQPFTCIDPITLDPPTLDYDAVISATQAAAAKGIAVYVVSLAPASGDFATHLDAVAQAGGTGQAYLPADPTALTARLRSIATDAISCELRLDGEVTSGKECDGSEVKLNDVPLDCNAANGWRLTDPSHIELTGSACTTYKEDPDATLQATFPCGVFAPG